MNGLNRSRSRIPQIRAVVSPLKRINKTELVPSISTKRIISDDIKDDVENSKGPRQRRLWHSMSSDTPSISKQEGSPFKRRHGILGDSLTKEDMLQIAKDALENAEESESVDECQFRREQAVFWLIRSSEMGCESAKDVMKSLLPQLPSDSLLKPKLQEHLIQTQDQLKAKQLGCQLYKDLARGKTFATVWDLHQTLVQGSVPKDQQHPLFDDSVNESIPCPNRLYQDDFVSACYDLIAHGDIPAVDDAVVACIDNGHFHAAHHHRSWNINGNILKNVMFPSLVIYVLWVTIQAKLNEYFFFAEEHSNPICNWIFSTACLIYVSAQNWHSKRRLRRWHQVLKSYQKDPDQSKEVTAKAKSWAHSVEFSAFVCGAFIMFIDPVGMARESSLGPVLIQALVIFLCVLGGSSTIVQDVLALAFASSFTHLRVRSHFPYVQEYFMNSLPEVSGFGKLLPISQAPCDPSLLFVTAITILPFGIKRYLGFFPIKAFILSIIMSHLEVTKSSNIIRSPLDLKSNLCCILPILIPTLGTQCTSLLMGKVTHGRKQTILLSIICLFATSSLIIANSNLEPFRPNLVHSWDDYLRDCSTSSKPNRQIECLKLTGHMFQNIQGQVENVKIVQRDLMPFLLFTGTFDRKHTYSCSLTLRVSEESYFPYANSAKVDLILSSGLWDKCLQVKVNDMIRAKGRIISRDLSTKLIRTSHLVVLS